MNAGDFDHARELLTRALPALTPEERQWVVRRLRGEVASDVIPEVSGTPGQPTEPRQLNHFLVVDSCLRRMQQRGLEREGCRGALFAGLLDLMQEAPVAGVRAGACVCLNVTRREVPAIAQLFRIWSLLMTPNTAAPNVDLAVCFDRQDAATYAAVSKALTEHRLDLYFRHIRLLAVDVPEEENFYYRHQSEVPASSVFPYGWKSGPNQQFFRLLRHRELRTYAELLLVETDCFPVSPRWIHDILEDARARPDFWVLGSPFRGRSKVGPDILLHLNGVAVYRIGEPRFFSMLAQWEARLKSLCVAHPETAYDCAQELYFSQKLKAESWHLLSPEDVDDYYDYRKMFVMTDRIANLAGEPERRGVGRYTLAGAMVRFPQARLFHANYLADEAIQLAEKIAREHC